MKSRSIITRLLEADQPDSLLGALADKAYARWREGGDLNGTSREEFIKALPEPTKLAVVVRQLISQSNNGGLYQWIDNGYADAGVDYLSDYCDEYGSDYPVFEQLRELLDEIDNALADAPGNSMRRRINSLTSAEDFENAVYEKDWDKIDTMLGGSDLDQRRFEVACEDSLSSARVLAYRATHKLKDLGDELKSEMGQPSKPDVWSWKLVGDSRRSTVFYTARNADDEDRPPLYNSEEEADEAGNDAAQQTITMDDLNEDETEAVEQSALEELVSEYSRHVPDPADLFDNLTDNFDEFKDELETAVNNIISNKEEPEAEPAAPPAPAVPATPPDYAPKGGAEDFRQESQAVRALIE
jgi:hypothetical protein